jgi:hypothetical protein
MKGIPMRNLLIAIIASTVLTLPAFAQNGQGQNGNGQGQNGGNGHHAAPGPIAGAGLPVIAVGFGIYWLIRRRRKPE